jgi:dimethylaniline monooxygenase (N-oxide forming)
VKQDCGVKQGMKIAVIGAGSSGLVTLKYLLDTYPVSDVVCFEKGYDVLGCWGKQRADFVSTSTKYTTQFSCFRYWQAEVSSEQNFTEFYRGSEFGDYLEAFAEHFELKPCIRFGVTLKSLGRSQDKWQLLLLENDKEASQLFDVVFLCTGLVNQKISLESVQVPLAENPETICNSTVVVVGGGESATDVANYLARPERNNKVFLSLRSGVRVSPRYHPIRGVPSDFLRNRLLLSFDKKWRNWLGEYFVTFRIRFQDYLSKVFPAQQGFQGAGNQVNVLRKEWDLKLKAQAKGHLFNVFHNKSDDFLDAVAQGRLSIIGPPTDKTWHDYFDFDQVTTRRIVPDVLVSSAGYESRLADLSGGTIHLKDFYYGCVHLPMKQLFLIGFARPIIGNIPSISEMQARYTIGLLSGTYKLPPDVQDRHRIARHSLAQEYSSLHTESVYPVEQFPYCDRLAKEMGILPSLIACGVGTWLKIQLVPASTTHYVDDYFERQMLTRQKVYLPFFLIALMVMIRLLTFPWIYLKRILSKHFSQ